MGGEDRRRIAGGAASGADDSADSVKAAVTRRGDTEPRHDEGRAGRNAVRLAPRPYGLAFADEQRVPAAEEAPAPRMPAGPAVQRRTVSEGGEAPPAGGAPPLDPVVRRYLLGGIGAPLSLQRRCACAAPEEKKLQPKLRIGQPDDAFERAADRVAAQLVDRPAPPTAAGPARPQAPPETLSSERLSFGGEPLAPHLRAYYEPRLGRDLSSVRVHADSEAGALNTQLNAYAFTYGSHIWLGDGQRAGTDFVFAHELAHVVQQGGTRPFGEASGAAPAGEQATVRRLGLSDEFWVPLGAAGRLGGTDIHEQLLGSVQTGNINIEAPAPNANLNGWGLAFQGSIDLYTGRKGSQFHVQPGLYFNGPNGAKNADVQATTPTRHRRATVAGAAAGVTFAPRIESKAIVDIAGGPEEVQLGELKPASADMLRRGAEQLEHYKDGMVDAARLTNDWAAWHKLPARWNLATPTLLPDTALTFRNNGQDMRFQPNPTPDPTRDVPLILASIRESSVGGKYRVTPLFNPGPRGLPPIMGRLYAQPFGTGTGLWMYFARPHPSSLNALLQSGQVSLTKQGEMAIANRVQDQVLDPLFQAPQQVAPLRRPHPAEPATLRRVPKPAAKLADKFDYAKWQPKVAALRGELFGPTATKTQTDELARLEALELAYKAENNLAGVGAGALGAPVLPDKAKNPVKIVSPPIAKGGTGKTHTKPLGDIFGWLKTWTSQPVEKVLGRFRQRFGGAFVWVAEKLGSLREKVREKFHNAFKAKSASAGGGKARILFKALGKALIQVAKVLLHKTVGLIVGAVEAGATKKLESLFDIEPLRDIEGAIEEKFEAFTSPLEKLRNGAEAAIVDAVKDYVGDLAWIGDVKALADKIGPIVEAATIALQCGTPPGWGCLKILLRKLNECAMDAVINFCPIQKEIAEIVEDLGPIGRLPQELAQIALNKLKAIAPTGIEDIFAEPVAGLANKSSGEIDCEPSAPEPGCPPGLFGGGAGGGGGKDGDSNTSPPPDPPKPEPVHEQLQKLTEEFNQTELEGLSEMVDASNQPGETRLTEEQVARMRDLLKGGRGLGPGDFAAMAQRHASGEVEAKLKPLQDWLDQQANQAIKDQLLKDLKAGKFAAQHADMAAAKQHWRFLKPYRVGSFVNYPVLMWDAIQQGVGVADGRMGECYDDGKVPVEFTRADIVDAAGKPIPVNMPFTVKDGQLTSKTCAPPQASPAKPGPAKPLSTKPVPAKPASPDPGDKAPAAPPAGSGQAPAGQKPPGGGGTGPSGDGGDKAPGGAGGGGKAPGSTAPNLKSGFEFCRNLLDCRVGAFPVEFEEVGGDAADGWFVLPGDRLFDPNSSGSVIRSAKNPNGLVRLDLCPDGRFDVLMEDDKGSWTSAGVAKPIGDSFEMVSGAALDQLKRAVAAWIKVKRNTASARSRAARFRFK
ncbi:MAG: DUF4157 domain-containing protein [Novosphingobium sp.]